MTNKPQFGPHGGPLIATKEGLLEISVFETNVPRQFRLYRFDVDRKPCALPPAGCVTIETIRPDGKRQTFAFDDRGSFLESPTEIPEPHEFTVVVTIDKDGPREEIRTKFTEEAHGHGDAAHGGHAHGHGHTHGLVDPMITTTDRGKWAVKWSFVALFITASLQLAVVILSNSVALLADCIHNFGDAATAIPLTIAFTLARRPATRRFNYGFGRVEDLAGLAVVLMILASAIVAGYEAISRLRHPQVVTHIPIIVAASIIGFVGNEGVAIFRIKVGKEIGSAALVADGMHARTDGWTSLAVLVGALGVHFGYPMADPIIGILITVAILFVVWASVKAVFSRMLDGVEPEYIDQITSTAAKVPGVSAVNDVRARWIGHRLRAEVAITVAPTMSVRDAHEIAKRVSNDLQDALTFLSGTIVHVDPADEIGESHHREQVSASQ
jgi:cation diffusion facilitator family transporter